MTVEFDKSFLKSIAKVNNTSGHYKIKNIISEIEDAESWQ
jgi:hypothetical protein